ncbi:MAG: OmpA family protein [Bacteroidota bacterium]
MDKRYIIVLLIAFVSMAKPAGAQEQPGLRGRAKQLYNQYRYFQAAELYQKLADSKKPFLEDLELLADCYLKLKDYELAENWFSRVVVLPKSKPDNLVAYGEVLKSNLKYEEAKKVFQQYIAVTGNANRVAVAIAGCDSSLTWLASPSLYQLKNQENINTPLSEFSVFPYQQKVFYTGEPRPDSLTNIYGRTGNPYLHIYSADKEADYTLVNPAIDSSTYNNGAYHIGPLSTNKAGNILYVTRTTSGKTLELTEINKMKYTTNNLELYVFKKDGQKWKEMPFAYNNVEKYAVGHATLSGDEQVLYFVSNRPGGFGGTDIWYCELQIDGTWGEPQNAGPNVNTPNDEMFPYISADGSLYFSSNGWPGMGGLDVFKLNGSKKNWSKAINLRYPLNSSADDFGFVLIANTEGRETGYISSNRKGGKGQDDIYAFNYQKPKLILAVTGAVTNKKTGIPISNTSISLMSAGQLVEAKQNSTSGTFIFELDKEKDYTLTAQKEKFSKDIVSISTRGMEKSDTLNVNLKLESLFEIGKIFTLENIKYDFDKDNIRSDAAKILDELVTIMRDNPSLEIELGSHTDSRGADKYNLNLSQRRAESVVNYLVNKGIARTRMIAKGYGETQLLNNCDDGVPCTDAQHQENRRTVFKVLNY